jgi:HEAT repeat protein
MMGGCTPGLRHLTRRKRVPSIFAAILQQDSYWRARALAAHALYDMAFDDEFRPLLQGVVLQLAGALQDESSHVRLSAAHTLGVLGPEAGHAISALRKAADNGDDELRRAAVDALATVAGAETRG